MEHACTCPTMVTCQPVLKLYPLPQRVGSSAAKTMKILWAKLLLLLANISGQTAFFSANFFSIQYRLSRTTSDPSRLIRPRPIDCDRVSEQPVKVSQFFANFVFRKAQQKRVFSSDTLSSHNLHPKEAHSRIFVTGRSLFARDRVAKKR